MAHLFLYLSLFVVAALAMRPKLSLALLALVPPALFVGERATPGGLPLWVLLPGMLSVSYSIGAVVLALFFRRAGDGSGYFGALPLGREARYSLSDKAGLVTTFIVLSSSTALCVMGASLLPGPNAIRIAAGVAAPIFAFAAFSFWRLIADLNVAVTVTEQALVVSRPGITETYPWNALGGYTFSFGVFRVLDKTGRLVLRVEHTIDGFFALLYHVNRKTFRVA